MRSTVFGFRSAAAFFLLVMSLALIICAIKIGLRLGRPADGLLLLAVGNEVDNQPGLNVDQLPEQRTGSIRPSDVITRLRQNN